MIATMKPFREMGLLEVCDALFVSVQTPEKMLLYTQDFDRGGARGAPDVQRWAQDEFDGRLKMSQEAPVNGMFARQAPHRGDGTVATSRPFVRIGGLRSKRLPASLSIPPNCPGSNREDQLDVRVSLPMCCVLTACGFILCGP